MPSLQYRSITAAVVLTGTLLAVSALHADEVRVMTSGAFAAAYLDLVGPFERATSHRVITEATITGVGDESIPSRIRRGEPVDVVILPDASLNELIKDGRILAATRVPLARSGIGMAVRSGSPKPDIGTVDAFKRTLLQARSIAYSAQVSGIYLSTELFPRLGIADAIRSKSQVVERELVGAVVARGEAEIGFQQVSELLAIKGLDFVGPLPPELQRITLVAAGVSAGTKSPEAARALIAFLGSPEGQKAMVKYRMEPAGRR
jgi:molybdate transport system substrate-binding protein